MTADLSQKLLAAVGTLQDIRRDMHTAFEKLVDTSNLLLSIESEISELKKRKSS